MFLKRWKYRYKKGLTESFSRSAHQDWDSAGCNIDAAQTKLFIFHVCTEELSDMKPSPLSQTHKASQYIYSIET